MDVRAARARVCALRQRCARRARGEIGLARRRPRQRERVAPGVRLDSMPASAKLGLLDGCWDVYVDVGSNIGIQIRKLFEPEAFRDAPVQATFSRYFGASAERRRSVCAVGFEPNPRHAPALDELERRYSALGWRVSIVRGAASDGDGEAHFHVDESVAARKRHDWGASLVAPHRSHPRLQSRRRPFCGVWATARTH